MSPINKLLASGTGEVAFVQHLSDLSRPVICGNTRFIKVDLVRKSRVHRVATVFSTLYLCLLSPGDYSKRIVLDKLV